MQEIQGIQGYRNTGIQGILEIQRYRIIYENTGDTGDTGDTGIKEIQEIQGIHEIQRIQG